VPLQYPTGAACENNLLSVGQIEVFEMVKLQALRVVICSLSISLMVAAAGLLPTLNATEDEPDNRRCVTTVGTNTCQSGGNSICDGADPCNDLVATFCSSGQPAPSTFCIQSEGSNCDENGQPVLNCGPGILNRCNCIFVQMFVQGCRCPNPMPMEDCGNAVLAIPCNS